MRRFLSFMAAVGLVGGLAADAAAAVVFEKVADTTTAYPGTQGSFREFNAPVHDGQGVVFRGLGPTTIVEGLFRYQGGQVVPLAGNGTPIPGGTAAEVLSTVNERYAASGGVVAFTGTTSSGRRAVFTIPASGGPLARVADTTTPRPEGGAFTAFGNPTVSGGRVAFVGGGEPFQPAGIYTDLSGTLTRVAGPTTPAPDGSGQFTYLNFPTMDGQRIAFEGGTPGGGGIFQYDNGTLSTRGTGGMRPSLSQDVVAYWGDAPSGSEAILLNDASGQTVVIADTTTPVPGATGNFGGFSPASIASEGGRVAFFGSELGGRLGLYLYENGTLTKIVDSTDVLDGRAIGTLSLVRDSLRGDQLAFHVTYAGQNAGQAVYLATIPEPGALGLCALALSLPLSRRSQLR